MTPEFEAYGDDLPPTESTLISRIEIGLDDALEELSLDRRRSESIKRQKYIYLAADYFTEDGDYPLTYSWYKWGVNQPSGPGEYADPRTRISESAGAQKLITTSQTEFKQFFINEVQDLALDDWWNEENHLNFLRQFYTEYPHPEYQYVYLSNIEILQIMTDIQQGLYREENPVDQNMYYHFCDETSSLRQAVLSADGLNTIYDELMGCLNLLEDVIMVLAKPESEVIQQGHKTAFDELKKFYQEFMWLIIANRISAMTAKGSDKQSLIQRSEERFSDLQSRFDSELETKKEICRRMNLLPDVEDYSEFEEESEFSESFEKFMSVVDGRTTCE